MSAGTAAIQAQVRLLEDLLERAADTASVLEIEARLRQLGVEKRKQAG